jgi:hypothetical protein
MAVRLEVEVLDSTGTPLFQIQHDDIRYVVARPGPYTVRVRHLGPQKMYITMSIDGTTCGECMVRSRETLGVVALLRRGDLTSGALGSRQQAPHSGSRSRASEPAHPSSRGNNYKYGAFPTV